MSALLSQTYSPRSFADERRADEASALFATRLQPLFVQKCGGCHGDSADEIKGEFDMRTREALLRGGESGDPAIDFDKPDDSLLLQAVRWEGLEMPPKENDRLTKEEVALVRRWIAGGAPWPNQNDAAWAAENDADGIRVPTSGGQSEAWTNRRYEPADLWAFQPLQSVEFESQDDEDFHPVDYFINRKLDEVGLEPAPSAGPRTLIRRVTYDLTGLPPTQEEVTAFNDETTRNRQSAFRNLVNRLLESPHYGERMAQHWLDVVRYADSNGFSRDEFRPTAHEYRTYVIRSFNEDKPYDRFVKEQIAGDQLKLAGQDALAFLWMGPWEHTGMSVAAVTRQLWLDDVTNSIGVTFLGQQLRCAKCHDHKFDPVPTRDYYSLQAIFADTKHSAGGGKFKIQSQRAEAVHILPGGSLDNPGEEVSPAVLSAVTSLSNLRRVGQAKRRPTHVSEENKRWAGASLVPPYNRRAMLANWIADAKNPLTARVMVNRVWQMHFGRGLVATPNDFGKMGAAPTHPELLDFLAAWFIENGWSVKKLHRLILTSATYQQSGRYKHAAQVSESSRYKHAAQASESDRASEAHTHSLARRARMVDPANKLLSCFPPRRLSAEELRDSMLTVSGELNRDVGGESVYPEINWEVAFQPRLLMGKLAPPYEPSSKRAERNRRSLYAVRIRNLGHPLMEVFNRPGTELSCERRDETTITPQVFTLMHGEFVHERAMALADRVAKEAKTPAEQVALAFRAVYHREPTKDERKLGIDHLAEMTALHQQHEAEPQPLPTSVTLKSVRERTGEPTEKKFKLKNLQNYEEDLKPWQVTPEVRALADLCLVLFNSSEFQYVY